MIKILIETRFNYMLMERNGLTGRERAKIAGAKGGRVSSRAGVLNGQGKKWDKYRKELKEDGYL